MAHVFTARVWQEGEWYVAQAVEQDVASQGESVEEAVANLREALELFLEPLPPEMNTEPQPVEVEVVPS